MSTRRGLIFAWLLLILCLASPVAFAGGGDDPSATPQVPPPPAAEAIGKNEKPKPEPRPDEPTRCKGKDTKDCEPPADNHIRLSERTFEQAQSFVETLIARSARRLGYRVEYTLAGSVEGSREWKLTAPGKTPRDLSLLLAPFPSGGFEVYVLGKEPQKISAIVNDAKVLRAEIANAPLGGPHDDIFVYPLSYIQADRAVAVLRTLGYPTVEYVQLPQDTLQRRPVPPDLLFEEFRQPTVGGSDGKPRLQENQSPRLNYSRPLIINLADSAKTTLVEDGQGDSDGRGNTRQNSDLRGGQTLSEVTDAVPQQQLMIVYDKRDLDSLDRLLALIQSDLDTPSRQILIEAQVIELDYDKVRELGIEFSGSENGWKGSFGAQNNGKTSPLTYTFNRPSAASVFSFMATIRALEEKGEATVLSSPSVLVLDGRQARIKVADEIPYSKQVSISLQQGGAATQSTEFLTAGIILNLRPRAAFDNSEVSMQVETIISSADSLSNLDPETNVLVAPVVQTRQVQTLIRVANDTPFVIGGLISLNKLDKTDGIPWLMNIPLIGRLFSRDNRLEQRKEVIVVITPHIIPEDDRGLAFTIPRDSDILDNFGATLFRDVYRIRSRDIFDLSFIVDNKNYQRELKKARSLAGPLSEAEFKELPTLTRQDLIDALHEREDKLWEFFKQFHFPETDFDRITSKEDQQAMAGLLQFETSAENEDTSPQKVLETFLTLFAEDIPGEEILFNRMMIQLAERFRLYEQVPEDSIFVVDRTNNADGALLDPVQLTLHDVYRDCMEAEKTLLLDFDPTGDRLEVPMAGLSCSLPSLESDQYREHMGHLNRCGQSAVLINDNQVGRRVWKGDTSEKRFDRDETRRMTPMEMLRSVLALERMLDLNDPRTFPRTRRGFHQGREVVFPTKTELNERTYLLDRKTVRLFYETLNYYQAFHRVYSRRMEAFRSATDTSSTEASSPDDDCESSGVLGVELEIDTQSNQADMGVQ